MTKINLKDQDSAVIFHANGDMEAICPKQEDGEDALGTSINAFRCMLLFDNQDFLAEVDVRIEGYIKRLREQSHE